MYHTSWIEGFPAQMLSNEICVYCLWWCKIGDELCSFVSRQSLFWCRLQRLNCNTASLYQAMRSIVYRSPFVARWYAAIGAFRSSLLFWLLDGVPSWVLTWNLFVLHDKKLILLLWHHLHVCPSTDHKYKPIKMHV